ncbi:hypothetical protein GH714_024495 [Hevea brasiliensis]|uniref:Disease resistance protein At4g27190-like leucine-rich repeats domain-containing protein n=1 Tax=Hevea brasiliensis TaxID=3981 RepID=A0A6A6LB31_HEVBR|nr:hypothetical protein GH714_024495 [Hevea brasiliensis]
MEELKVLDLTGMHLSPLPLSLQYLENLQTLCLDDCVLEDTSAIGELKQLQVLSFIESTIVRLPSEVRKLTRLRLLDLSRCRKLEVIPPDVLSRLAQLEELYMGECFVQWEGEGHDEGRNNASLSELKLLSKLSTLEVHIKEANIMPKDLFSEKLESFRVAIGDVRDWDLPGTTLVEEVDVKGCTIMEEIVVEEGEDDEKINLPQLRYLRLENLPQFISFCSRVKEATTSGGNKEIECEDETETPMPLFSRKVSFPNLTILIVDGCDNLKNLLSLSSVVHLKRLEICNCKMMEEVMVKEGLEEEIMKLRIQNCPQMRTFVSNYTTSNMASSSELDIINSALFDEKVAFPNLEQLEILNMDNLKMIWHNELHSDSFCKINALTVENCEELLKIFPSMLLRGLRNLQSGHTMPRKIDPNPSCAEAEIRPTLFVIDSDVDCGRAFLFILGLSMQVLFPSEILNGERTILFPFYYS